MSNDPREPGDDLSTPADNAGDADSAATEVTADLAPDDELADAATELIPELDTADTAFVGDLLASAGTASIGAVPADVADRWSAAIKAEAVTRSGLAAEGVIPMQRHRSGSAGRFNPMRFAGIAAGAAAVALLGGIVVNQAAESPEVASTNPIVAGAAEASTPPTITNDSSGQSQSLSSRRVFRPASAVTTSGVTYTQANLEETVMTLVMPRTLADVPPSTGVDVDAPVPDAAGVPGADIGSGSDAVAVAPAAAADAFAPALRAASILPASQLRAEPLPVPEPSIAPEPALSPAPTATEGPTAGPPATTPSSPDDSQVSEPSTGNPLMSAAFNKFRSDKAQRDGCVQYLAQSPNAQAVALDIGYYNRQPTILAVILAPDQPDAFDVYLIGADCDADSADVRYFARIAVPA